MRTVPQGARLVARAGAWIAGVAASLVCAAAESAEAQSTEARPAAPATSGASPPADGAPPDPAIEVVVTARRLPESRQQSDRAVGAATAEQVTRAQPRSVPEALREIPGVAFQSTNRGAGAPILRGLIGPRNLLLFEGLRLNQSTWRNGPLQYLAQFDPWAFERIEVQFGPGSVVHGSDAMGGAVNLVPYSMPDAERLMLRGRWAIRTADAGLESSGQAGGRVGDLAGLVGGAWRSYGRLQGGDGEQIFTDYESFGFRAQGWYELSSQLALQVGYFGGGVRNAGRTDQLGTGRLTRFDNTDHHTYAGVRLARVGILRELRVTSLLRVGDEVVRQQDCDSEDGLVLDPRGCVAGDPTIVNRRRRLEDSVVTPGLSLTAAFGQTDDRIRVTVGGDGYLDLVESERFTARRPDFAYGEPERGQFSSGSQYLSTGAFAVADLDVIGSPTAPHRIVLSGGARVAAFAAHAPDVPIVGDVDNTFGGVVGQASVRYLYESRLAVFASWSQGLRAPNLQETSLLGNEGGGYVIPNPDVRPERANSFELGARGAFEQVRVAAVGFVSRLDRLIVREPVAMDEWLALGVDPEEVGSSPVQRFANTASGLYLGGDAWLEARPVSWLSVWAQTAIVHGTETAADESEQPTQKTPPPMGSFGVRTEQPRWYLELFSRWALAQHRLNAVDRADLRTCEDPNQLGVIQEPCDGTPGWLTINVRGGMRITPNLRLDVVLENLTDATFRYHASGVDEPGLGATIALTAESW